MFKSREQVATFIDYLEKFNLAIINNHNSSFIGDATSLNKRRDELETFIMVASGIMPSTDTTDTLVCPDCGADMALRTNKQSGSKFWGCKKFPACRGTRDEDGLSKLEREVQKQEKVNIAIQKASQEDGFSFNREKRNPVTEVSPPVQNTGWINPFAK